MAEGKKQWYVLKTISGKEQKIKEMLDAACKNDERLREHLFQVLVPTEKVFTTHAGKKVQKERNLLSGYVFVQCDLDGETEDMLQNTTNVINFVRTRESSHRPEPIRESDIARMLGAAEAEGAAPEGEDGPNDFIVGENVKVTFGPFNGFTGEIEEVNREKRKLKVMVKVFGRKTPMELDNSQVSRE